MGFGVLTMPEVLFQPPSFGSVKEPAPAGQSTLTSISKQVRCSRTVILMRLATARCRCIHAVTDGSIFPNAPEVKNWVLKPYMAALK